MEIVNKILFLLSDGMLIPVMVLLIFFFIRSLLLIGGFFSLSIRRAKYSGSRNKLLLELSNNKLPAEYCKNNCKGIAFFDETVKQLAQAAGSPARCEKILAEAELQTNKECEKSRIIMRVGPMLGLMGTIIPMGPALTGLASGNLSTMALNMQIAFATTVIGLFCGITGFVLNSILRRWFAEDMVKLYYVCEVLHGRK